MSARHEIGRTLDQFFRTRDIEISDEDFCDLVDEIVTTFEHEAGEQKRALYGFDGLPIPK